MREPYSHNLRTMLLKDTYERSEIHAAWESIYRDSPVESRINDRIMDRVLSYMNPPANAFFLDAGCGVGDHALRIAKRGFRCIGVDISEHILRVAQRNAAARGLTPKVKFVCQALEQLSFPDGMFDAVHCRGVLMHIPDWEQAAANLCRVLKPGGKIVIMETNHKAIELAIVLLVRKLTVRNSRMVKTPGGFEFWSEEFGNPFVVRVADLKYLANKLREHQVETIKRFATGFLEIGRFPKGPIRKMVVRVNQLYFYLHLPASLAIDNAIIGEKKPVGASISKV